MKKLKEKIKDRMDSLQEQMESNLHLEDSSEVENTIDSISKFWSSLSYEDREYIQMARDAIEEKTEWKIN